LGMPLISLSLSLSQNNWILCIYFSGAVKSHANIVLDIPRFLILEIHITIGSLEVLVNMF
jgi:hypothetical protein